MDTVIFIVALLVMLVGLLGIIVPILPGVPLIFSAAFLYALITSFSEISLNIIIIFAALAVFTLLLDWLSATYGVKKMGGSYAGMIGAFFGMIIGLFSGGLIGLVIGAFLGAFLLELLVSQDTRRALRAGLGSFIGFLAGGVLKFAIGATMIGIFIWQILF